MALFGRAVPVILQSEAPECGIACLAMIASYHGHLTDLSAMRLRLSPSLKGVTLKHVSQVAESMGLAARNPARVLAIDWGGSAEGEFNVDIDVKAFDRHGLVRDVSAAIADEKISIRGMSTLTDKAENLAHLQLTLQVSGLPQLSRVLARIAQLPNVISARRRR